MRLCTVDTENGPRPAVDVPGRGFALLDDLTDSSGAADLLGFLHDGDVSELGPLVEGLAADKFLGRGSRVLVPYRHPRKILGIGLNYREHAHDLGAVSPHSSPASFLKGDHTIIGPDDEIVIPGGIGRVTAEAELGLVIGSYCHNVTESEALSHVVGIRAILDQTAEEVLMENPRFLTRVKNYPTFFSFGPNIITMDEVRETVGDLRELSVSTIHNGVTHRTDVVAGMMFSPAQLLSFHSSVMPFYPGDILSTGTPGAVAISPGDVVACELGDGLAVLTNTVSAAS